MSRGVLVHEWLARTGGSENVFDIFTSLFPDEDVVCLWNDVDRRYGDREVSETWLARTPLRRSKALALPLMPGTWRSRRGSYDWALVSSHLFAHHVAFTGSRDNFRKYVYIHSPARYLWEPELDRRGAHPAVRLVAPPLKAIDRRRAVEITSAASNSEFVRRRVERAWGIESRVIYPPVEVERIQSVNDWRDELNEGELAVLDGLPGEFLLGASRLIPYKELDLVIATGKAANLPVVIAGSGPEKARLQQLAVCEGVDAHFLGRVSDSMLYALYQQCIAYVFPAVEDFGIMPVEAMATGASVIGRDLGGALETIVEGVSGTNIGFQSESEMRDAVDRVSRLESVGPRKSAHRFGRRRFEAEVLKFVGVES